MARYAVTAHRAQGVTVDTAHVLVEPTTTRENFYVAMTRGKHSNEAYVVLDRPDDAHAEPHPGDSPDATARSVLFGVLTAELRRAEANHHDLDRLFPRLVTARGFDDADDIASVLHHRVARATARPAGSGRVRKAPRLIAGLIPHAGGSMTEDMRHVLDQRRELIEQRADAALDNAQEEDAAWTKALGTPPRDQAKRQVWRRRVRTIAAYRDRYGITDNRPLGAAPESTAQKIDRARAEVALRQIAPEREPGVRRRRGGSDGIAEFHLAQ